LTVLSALCNFERFQRERISLTTHDPLAREPFSRPPRARRPAALRPRARLMQRLLKGLCVAL